MNCATATQVYSSSNPLLKIQELFPLAWDFFASEAFGFISKTSDVFDSQVKEIVGPAMFEYRVVHRDDTDALTLEVQELLGDITSRLLIEDYFSNAHNQPIFFSTVCCTGCISASRPLELEEALKIQIAAVSLQPSND